MPIEFKTGDMFQEPTEAIVNTVNCVGVMGKGVALEFKRRWPANFRAYKHVCDAGELKPGKVFVFENQDFLNTGIHRYLVNFPTKQHWRAASRMEFIDSGLDDLVGWIKKTGVSSIALPPLGCGNGGLNWSEVRLLIEEKLSDLEGVRCAVFAPVEAASLPEQTLIPTDLTQARAIMMVAFSEFEKFFGGGLTRLTAQKLAYFLQVSGINFGLKFVKEQFGPYSETLHASFKALEKKGYLTGYAENESGIVVTQAAYAASDELLRKNNFDSELIIKKLSLLIDGYENPYGMELLSSVYFLYAEEGISTQPEMSEALEAWSKHKRQSFPRDAVEMALSRLKEDGYIISG